MKTQCAVSFDCSQKSKIDTLMERVLNGNGKPPLMTRMAEQETATEELVKIVKGEHEGEGLQHHVTELLAWKKLLKWEMHAILAGVAAICAILALKH